MADFAHATAAIGLLVKGSLSGVESEEMEVAVKDSAGHPRIRVRHLVQVGQADMRVTRACRQPVVAVTADTVVVSVVAYKEPMKTHWRPFKANPLNGTRKWLTHRAKVKPVDEFLSPNARSPERPDLIKVSARVATRDVPRLLTASGLDGVSVWDFGSDHRLIHMPHGTALETAQRRADNQLERHLGIVCSHRGCQ